MHIIKFRILTSVLLVLCRAVLGQSPKRCGHFMDAMREVSDMRR